MKNNLFISSLHRPFNTRLKTCKWVCSFSKNYKGNNFKNDFFIYIINFLYQYFRNANSIYGLPKKETIEILHKYIISNNDIQTDLSRFGDPSKKNFTEIDKKLFSNLKAVSYYITLSKNIGLLDSRFMLTEDGLELSSFRSSSKSLMSLSYKEKFFLTKKILENDFVPFVFSFLYYHLKKKYEPSKVEKIETDNLFLQYLDNFLKIREFKYKQSSWGNYMTVRENWIKDLELLSKTYSLKPSYKKLLENNSEWLAIYQEISKKMAIFEQRFKTLNKYQIFKKDMYRAYKKIKKRIIFNNINYVNLYDIKDELKISFNELEYMINRLAIDTDNRQKVFFNNIIAAVDQRKRFKIKNSSVLNIRIIKAIT